MTSPAPALTENRRFRYVVSHHQVLGAVIRGVRKANKLSQTDLARHLQHTQTQISRYESGGSPIRPDDLSGLGRFLGTTGAQLLKAAEDALLEARGSGVWVGSDRNLDPTYSNLPVRAIATAHAARGAKYCFRAVTVRYELSARPVGVGGYCIEWANDVRVWFLDGVVHREDAPAIERPDGSADWYSHGKIQHRETPPAEKGNGWWLEET